MKFLSGYSVDIKKIPKYLDLGQEFKVHINEKLAKMITESDGVDKNGLPHIPHESMGEWNKLASCIKNNSLIVKYSPRKGLLGRRYPDCPSPTFPNGRRNPEYGRRYGSLCMMPRVIKNTIFHHEGWIDFDQVKGHPTILLELAERNKNDLPAYKEYLIKDRFEELVKEISDYHSVEGDRPLSRSDVKWLFNKTIYGGGFGEWIKDIRDGKKKDMGSGRVIEVRPPRDVKNEDKPHPFYTRFKKDTQFMIETIYNSNKELENIVCDGMSEEKENLWRRKNRVMSYFCGIVENELTYQAYKYAHKNGMCRARQVDWGYDGFTIPPVNEEEIDINYHVRMMNNHVRKQTGFKNVSFIRKKIDEGDVLKEVIEQYESISEVDENEKLDDLNDGELAEAVIDRFNHWVYCKGILYVFDEKTRMWSDDKMIHIAVLKRVMDGVVSKKVLGLNNVQRAITQIASMVVDDAWISRMCDTSLKKLLFNNGYYDGDTGTFHTEPDPTIMFMGKIPHDYGRPSNDDEMDNIFKRFFADPLTEEVGKYYLELLARGLMGEQLKKIVFGLGDSNTGKSTITKALQASVGSGYVNTFNAECFTLKHTSQDEAQVLRWALLNRFKRLIFSNELTNNAPLNGNMIKKVSSGGDEMVGRVHGGLETTFTPHFMVNCFANDITEIKPYDDAVRNRMNVVGYNKVFVENPREGKNELKIDPNIMNDIRKLDFQRAFVNLMIRAYENYKRDGALTVPAEMELSIKEWVSQDTQVVNKLMECYEITGDHEDYVASSEMKEWVNRTKLGISEVKFARELKKYVEQNNMNVIKKAKKIGGRSVMVWFGIRACADDEEGIQL